VSVTEVTFFKKNWNKNLNTIKFNIFTNQKKRKCLKLGYDFKTLLLSAENIFSNFRKSWKLLRRFRFQGIINKFPHIFVGIAGSWDWSHYENLQMVF
jgi:hypothetical protein